MSQRSPFNKRNMPQGEDEKKQVSSGLTRKSPTKAKPVREAGSSVRVVTKKKNPDGSTSTAGMTKEEKKEVRRAEREEARLAEQHQAETDRLLQRTRYRKRTE